MVARGEKIYAGIVNLINESVLLINAPRPLSAEFTAQPAQAFLVL